MIREGPQPKPDGQGTMKKAQARNNHPFCHKGKHSQYKKLHITNIVHHILLRERMQSCINMKPSTKEKGKAAQVRAIEDVVFSTEMAALDFEPTREEETFLQLIGLDRFITRVTWEIINIAVIQEVISNLNLETMESSLNGRVFPIFGKDWKNKMRAVFYISAFSAKREPDTRRVKEVDVFPSYNEKVRTKAGTCRIADCTIPEAKRPLRFFNSLFLLRTSASTLPCSAISHISDALNGKLVDWPLLFRENLLAELRNIKEGLFKDRTTGLKSMVGPPLTMLLIAEELLTVSQEVQAGILVPSILEEPGQVTKKRKHEPEQNSKGTERGESSVHQEQDTSKQESSGQQGNSLQPKASGQQQAPSYQEPSKGLPAIEVALADPIPIHPEDKTACISSKILYEILEKFKHTSSCFEETFKQWSASTPKLLLETLHKQQEDSQKLSKATINEQLEQELTAMKVQNKALQDKMEFLQKQHQTELAAKTSTEQGLQTRIEKLKANLVKQRVAVAAIATQFQQVKLVAASLREEAQGSITKFRSEVGQYTASAEKLYNQKVISNHQRALEIAKLEIFYQCLSEKAPTTNQISAQQLFDRIATRIGHMFKTLQNELSQATTERDELQEKLEQQEEYDPFRWEKLLGYNNIEDPANMVAATMKNLAPPISIFQYYQAYKPLILKWSGLPDLRNQSQITAEQFQALWAKATPTTRDLLVSMWVFKDLILPKGVVEVTTANPPFYLTRFCISALAHIDKHHEEFYSNVQNRNSLPNLQPYEPETITEIQAMADSKFPEFLLALDILASEDTTILHEATQHHQNLSRKFPDSFPPIFHRIQLHGYISRALDDRRHTLEQRQISTPHSRTLLYLPQLDPGTMKIPKRS